MNNGIFSISMYSGNKNPEVELTEEQSQKIIELSLKLDKPYYKDPKFGLSALGPTSYVIDLFDRQNNCPINNYPIIGLYVEPTGHIRIYRGTTHLGDDVEDTVGLWEYLATIGGPLYRQHLQDAQKAMDDYVASLSSYTPPPWEPNF